MTSNKKPILKPRNPAARSPLMRKGGAHEKSDSAKRRQVKDQMKSELEDWREAVDFEKDVRVPNNDN